jgi:integrase
LERIEQTRLERILKRNGDLPSKKSMLYKDATDYLNKFASSRSWLANLRSKATRRRYTRLLFEYCASVGKNPDELLKLKPSLVAVAVATRDGKTPEISEREAEDCLEAFLTKTKRKDKLGFKFCIISFYKHNNRPLVNVASNVEQRQKPASEYNVPTVEDIEALARATVNSRDEFLIWFLASTGFRRGTVSQLKFGDLIKVYTSEEGKQFLPFFAVSEDAGELDDLAPVALSISGDRLKGSGLGKYRGNEQTTFLHFRAYQSLQQYLSWLRDQKISVDKETPLFVKSVEPYDSLSNGYLATVVERASVDSFQNGKNYTTHDLRRFQHTQLEAARTPANWIDKMQGHKPRGVSGSYSLPDLNQLHEAFKQAVPYFIPANQPQPQVALSKQLHKQATEISQLKELVDHYKPLEQQVLKLSDTMQQVIEDKFKQLDQQHAQTQKQLDQKRKQLEDNQ